MGIPPKDSSDLVQDALLIAIREIRSGRFRRDSSIITWLDGILKNKIKDFWRAQNRRRSLFTSIEPASAGIHDSSDLLSPGWTHTECRVNVSGVRLRKRSPAFRVESHRSSGG